MFKSNKNAHSLGVKNYIGDTAFTHRKFWAELPVPEGSVGLKKFLAILNIALEFLPL